MAVVRIDFRPPIETDVVALRIHEAPEKDGPFAQIERTTAVGAYPDYISHYTTSLATNAANWFAIQWEYVGGALSELSASVKGGTENLVSEIVQRVMLRDYTVNENVAAQEAEAVVEQMFPDRIVREVMSNEATYTQISGMTLLTLARSYMMRLITTGTDESESYTAGLVSQKSSSGGTITMESIENLVKLANKLLGRSFSVILMMKEVEIAGGLTTGRGALVAQDHSRLIVEYE